MVRPRARARGDLGRGRAIARRSPRFVGLAAPSPGSAGARRDRCSTCSAAIVWSTRARRSPFRSSSSGSYVDASTCSSASSPRWCCSRRSSAPTAAGSCAAGAPPSHAGLARPRLLRDLPLAVPGPDLPPRRRRSRASCRSPCSRSPSTVGCAAAELLPAGAPARCAACVVACRRGARRRLSWTDPTCRGGGRAPATFRPSHRLPTEESHAPSSADRDVKRPPRQPGRPAVGGVRAGGGGWGLAGVVARQDLFGDELATYWVVSTRGLRGVVETVSTTAEITPPLSFVLSWLTTRSSFSPEAGPPAGAGRRGRVDPVGLRGGRPHGWPGRGAVGGGADDVQPVHDLLLGRGAGLRRPHGAGPGVDPRAADRRRRRTEPLVGGLRRVRLPRRLHALHGGVRARRSSSGGRSGPVPRSRRPLLLATAVAVLLYLPWLPSLKGDIDSPTTDILSAFSPFNLDGARLTLGHWTIGFPYGRARPARWATCPGGRAAAAGRQPRAGRLRASSRCGPGSGSGSPPTTDTSSHRRARAGHPGRQPPAERRRRQRLQHPQPGRRRGRTWRWRWPR